MTQRFKVGDRVKALAYTDSGGKFHGEVTGLVVDSVTRHGGVHGVAEYDRLNCYAADLGDRLARRHTSQETIRVEAAARFFAHEYSQASELDADTWDAEFRGPCPVCRKPIEIQHTPAIDKATGKRAHDYCLRVESADSFAKRNRIGHPACEIIEPFQ